MEFKIEDIESDKGRSVRVSVEGGASYLLLTVEVGDTNRYVYLNRSEGSALGAALKAAADSLSGDSPG